MAKTEKSSAELYREQRKKRIAKANKKNARKSITSQSAKIAGRVISIIIAAAIIIGLGFVGVNQSGIIERAKAAFTIGGVKVSQAEYGYYYIRNFEQYYQYAQYGYISMSATQPLSQQPYGGEMGEIEGLEEGKEATWADFMDYVTRRQLVYNKACCALAKEAGIELSDADLAEIDSEIEEMEESINQNSSGEQSTHYSVSAYLKQQYGKGMNEKVLRTIMRDQHLASEYAEMKTQEFSDALTDKEINKEYKENITSYGKISVAYFNVPAEKKADADGNEAATEETLKAAEALANKLAKAGSRAEFEALCRQAARDNESITSSDVTNSTDASYSDLQSVCSESKFLEWVSGTGTKTGSTYVYNDGTDGSTVFFMVEPIHKAPDAVVYDSRHILIKFPEKADAEAEDDKEVEDSEDAAPAEEISVDPLDLSAYGELDFAVEDTVGPKKAANMEAYASIRKVLDEYLKGDHSEDAFAALAEKYSEDTGSNTNGGLYENVEIGNFVAPYEDWCLADGRKAGDVGIVEYDNSENYSGYHLIYFVGQKNTSWKDDVKEALASAKYNDETENIAKEGAQPENVNPKVIAAVDAFTDKLIKRISSNSSSSY